MSSPNLNLVTLLGSSLAYISGYLFGIQEHAMVHSTSLETLIQVRFGLLYIGTSLVFGPILGKSWRLYKVFTQRVPDKRVIIKDLQLLGLVALLVLADTLLLMIWVFSDPIQCIRSLNSSIQASEKELSCSITRTHFCASLYSDLWIVLLFGFKGILLIYGTYLAGLTDNMSSPPVNQSSTIMVGVNLVILSTGGVFLVTRFFHTWPSVVYGLTSGGIFICTTTINCFIFIPQLIQWKQFKEDQNPSMNQMAKYFNSPSKSYRSMYSEEQIYHLLGENNSMKRLLTEKDAVIESLQEQVNNAKDKLIRLMSSECNYDPSGLISVSKTGSSVTYSINGSPKAVDKVITTELTQTGQSFVDLEENQMQNPSNQNTQSSIDRKIRQNIIGKEQKIKEHNNNLHTRAGSSSNKVQLYNLLDMNGSSAFKDSQDQWISTNNLHVGYLDNIPKTEIQTVASGVADSSVEPSLLESSGEDRQPLAKLNYVSSEKLQEILQELSINTTVASSCRSSGKPRKVSHSVQSEDKLRSPEDFKATHINLSPCLIRTSGLAYSSRAISLSSHFPGTLPHHILCIMNKTANRTYNGLKTQTHEKLRQTPYMKANDINFHYQSSSSVFNKDISLQMYKKKSPGDPGDGEIGRASTKYYSNDQSLNIAAEPLYVNHETQAKYKISSRECLEGPERRIPSSCMDSDSSSSEEIVCCCRRPYCEICFQNAYESSDSCTSETESETCGHSVRWTKFYANSSPIVNFKEDLTPTFV
nr:probable G-protein coupled receptor 156 isoform X2 [Geotrypetes seraphini]XP_033796075.1 probable G-protein coupled receptor 156 isoform X2 [Geotrypetes seraphini]XP_033796076.1 probable G-protein coupled receptor 156 isoform X2 [Geotrypetes seraphini]XP_033796077.1 probable G-protein coupled receptor 156 isoform X2 [Geotrypetes seraphini]XP_033796078.1 probable G-protein coupled receptor 156 isoform X2 [Geotrypetes seraphini]